MTKPKKKVPVLMVGVEDCIRLSSLFEIDHSTGCWSMESTLDPGGYARFWVPTRSPFRRFFNKVTTAQRAAYIMFKGPIGPGLQVDHLCKSRRCVNPKHLEAVTPAENIRRSDGVATKNAAKTHCKRGHELVGDNLIKTLKKGRRGRQCRYCVRASQRRYKDKKRSGLILLP